MRPDLPFEMRRLLAMHFVRPRSISDMRRTLSQIPLHLPRQQPVTITTHQFKWSMPYLTDFIGGYDTGTKEPLTDK
ncbi:hypothetical protein GWI33_012897 [Rhynchophorus ferrugineus]|uniref:Uncharacterized protein n=1 Tax=Rhynchophorus ferrugineus TaxID=354439 RepID=A0A834I8A1_RHYFE|nr:hypothetical protein GWI33_012897 [Rhynchophorus ferrugineus]